MKKIEKNRIISALIVFMILLAYVFFVGNIREAGDILTTAAQRDINEPSDGTIYISDEYVALAASPQDATMGKNTLTNMNKLRTNANLSTLVWSNELATAAQVRAQEAATTWSHSRPDGSDYWTVNSEIVYGENLAKGYTTPEAIIAAWQASPSHKSNMLFTDYKTCGIAFYTDANGTLYTACEFGY